MQGRVLVTGFMVFAGYQFNPSEWIAATLDGQVIEGYRVHSLVLPVSLRRALPILKEHLETLKPQVVLGLGLAPRARKVTVELVAVSLAHYPDYPDEDGYRADLQLLDNGGLRTYTTRIPLEAVRACRGKGYPVTVSVSVGTYLCNAVAYAIHRYAHHNNAIGGFLHLPPTTELAHRHGLTNTTPLWLELETVKCILRETIRLLHKAPGKL
ncbi:pyrrolidone-carboxylate peptidase [Hyperthermus butylicus]|uniref:Pyrrolidone-carboxylate peptidase n=1 Tax=Hyperthermus butylicus (strain DSM 5456 / JCM 9403 / PLM1-5) TaxID=415426 RepID=A2BN71_HYPBU|nr:pyrrolidone-carboxylate peptidase [Hyperthermus butylicus]ABM81432.1 Pyrrolidone-carboxylate peptidase [Hyperthermus butylicus DSM 5456]